MPVFKAVIVGGMHSGQTVCVCIEIIIVVVMCSAPSKESTFCFLAQTCV